ncbi:MBL fold metallo-hydrolase [Holophaga foetida]|uniref:MBL fold metallo-hydrolase n=1 Tax=Holophaga foetida TaxID=35839 RepID=UPI0002475033|nr:MBL fold metallo-hydrolase [Holophaga foetida]
MDKVRITLLVDNQAAMPGLQTEHGLSFWIQRDADTVLFDTGASGAWAANAQTLGLPTDTIQHLVLSHGHRDHTGGIPEALQASPEARIYMHPKTLMPRYSLHPGMGPRPLGLPSASWKALTPYSDALRWSTAPMRLARDMGITGPILRRHPQESSSGPFFLDPEGRQTDPLEDDQALWIQTPEGLVIVLGCAHAGVANTLDHIREITGESRIRAVIGGIHLAKADQERLEFTAERIREAGVQEVQACHCTGESVALSMGYGWMRAGGSWET